jgi:HK97 family phage portal protein
VEVRTADGGFETRSANPYQPWGSSAPPSNGQLGMGAAGVQVSEKTALALAAVWGSCSIIADAIATLPIRQYKRAGLGAEPVEIPLSPVIQRPWAEFDDSMDFIVQGTMSMLLRGNMFGQVVDRDAKLYPSQIKLVHPDHVKVERDRKTGQIVVRYWNQIVSPDNVTRKMALSRPEDLVGLNPIEYMRNVMGVARAQDLSAGAVFSNSALPGVAITVPGDLDPNQAQALKNGWNESFQGISHAYSVAVLTGGMTVEPIAANMADIQFLEQMQFSESVISGRIYRIPPHMLGMVDKDTSWGAGIEQQEIGFVRNTLLIWLKRWEDFMRTWLPPNQFVAFDLSQRLHGDTLQRWQAYQIARIIGAMNIADVARAEGLPVPTPSDPEQQAFIEAYNAPLNSSPMKVGGAESPGGDKAGA